MVCDCLYIHIRTLRVPMQCWLAAGRKPLGACCAYGGNGLTDYARETDGRTARKGTDGGRPSRRVVRGDGDGGDARASRGVAVEWRGAHVGGVDTAWKCRQWDCCAE